MYSNRDYEQYQEFRKQRDNPLSYFFKKTSPEVIIALIGLAIIGYYFTQKADINPYFILGCIVAIVAIIIYQLNKTKEGGPIDLPTARLIAVAYVERSVSFVYERGTQVIPGEFARMQYQGEFGGLFKEWKWEIGVKIIKASGLKSEVRVVLDPFSGFCTAILPAYSGFTGMEARDLKVLIPTNEFNVQQPKTKAP